MINLNDVLEVDVELIGKKAANLGLLIQNDINVPYGYVITIDAYNLFLKYNHLEEEIQKILSDIDNEDIDSIKLSSVKIRNYFLEGELPLELISELRLSSAEIYNYPLAIRSSASAEDLPYMSFAGQYDSYLNINGENDIIIHIKRCYSSLWTTRAISYRIKNKIPHLNLGVAVIIQKLIPAKSAGILFTVNPINYDQTQLIIESNFGLGESIASGKISPDQFIVQKESKKKKLQFKIIDRRVGNKKVYVQPEISTERSGVQILNLPDELNGKPSLADKQILKLSKIGSEIENIFGRKPQDIEWAIDKNGEIFILQTRPITSKGSSISSDLPIYSRGYSDDYWNDDTTPLFFDLLGSQITKVVNIELNSIMGYQRIDDRLIKLYKGHVYFNLDVLKRKVEYEIPTFIRNEDVLNYFPNGHGPYGKETVKKLPFRLLKRLLSELRIRFHDPDGRMSNTADKYEEWTNNVFEPYCKEFDMRLRDLGSDLKALFRLAEDFDMIMVSHFRLIRYGIPVHNIGMNLMTQYLLRRFFGKEEAQRIFPILISGLNHKLTETNDRIYELGLIIQSSPYLKSIFNQNDSFKILKRIQTDDNREVFKFLEEFNIFLSDFGDRGFTREIYYPRWKEAPHLIIDILRSLSIEDWGVKTYEPESNILERDKIEKIVERKIRSKIFGPVLWLLFSAILRNSRKYIIFRENQRFNLDKWITRNRELFLEIGNLLVKQGLIEEKNLIFFLYKNEIKKIIFEGYDPDNLKILSELAKKRLNDFLKYENVLPPKFLLGSKEFDDILDFDESSKHFQGIPASQGIVTAPIRILNDINSIPSVHSGEILVVPRTDPGWTPVFSKIGGLVTETGGILSHGAVVSREYGIPAVTNITNACKIFKTGQILSINGFNGICTLKE